MSQLLNITKGTDRIYNLQIQDPLGNPITSYTTGDVLSAEVWLGKDDPVLFNPSVSWISAPSGTYQLSFGASQTASLASGRYFVGVSIDTVDNRTVEVLTAQVDLVEAPGTATALSTYATLTDALVYAPWLKDLIRDQDFGDLSDYFHLARTWLEGIIQNKWQFTSGSGLTIFGFVSSHFPTYSTGAENKYLQDLLDANKLMVRARVIEITAKRAIGTMLRAMVSPTSGQSNYQQMATAFLAEADALVLSYTAELDLSVPPDGYPDIVIPCGLTSIR